MYGENITTFDFQFPEGSRSYNGMYNVLREAGGSVYRLNIKPAERNKYFLDLKDVGELPLPGKEIKNAVWYTCKIMVKGNSLYLKAWEKSAEEPKDWELIREMEDQTGKECRLNFSYYDPDGRPLYLDNVKVEVLDPSDVEKRLTGIEIKAEPEKNTYYAGEEFDASGLKVNAVYNNDSKQELDKEAYTVTGFDSATEGDKTITVSYRGYAAEFTVQVAKAPAMTGIRIAQEPYKTVYEPAEELDLNGLAVKAVYDNGTEQDVLLSECSIEGFSSETGGTKTIKVSYQEFSAEFEIEVKAAVTPEKVLTSIRIDQNPGKMEYLIGEELNLDGLVVTAVYDDESEEPLAGGSYSVTGFDSDTEGTKTVTIQYKEQTAEFTVQVKEAEQPEKILREIRIDQMPDKTEYFVGDELNLTGLQVMAVYDDESEKLLGSDAYTAAGFDSETEGTKTIMITYQDKTAEFKVEGRTNPDTDPDTNTDPHTDTDSHTYTHTGTNSGSHSCPGTGGDQFGRNEILCTAVRTA
ncbi:bacterial Ig-like domain-containing protein [Diplocloster modestus]|uniref:Bacterial Ig-like domain-containing protein n=1 Tax=Diplocloster modestus TaxID=2850322 RepID=A0ABS6K6S2_9FIRM|nr:bacterial Ig-like domain-containing protein [Diplocloster modestus]